MYKFLVGLILGLALTFLAPVYFGGFKIALVQGYCKPKNKLTVISPCYYITLTRVY